MQDDDILAQGMSMLDGNVLASSPQHEKTIEDYAHNTAYKTALDAYYTAICAQLWITAKDDPNMYGNDDAKRILALKKVFSAGAVYGPIIKKHLQELGCKDLPDNSSPPEKPASQQNNHATGDNSPHPENKPQTDTQPSHAQTGSAQAQHAASAPSAAPSQAQTHSASASPSQAAQSNNAAQPSQDQANAPQQKAAS